MIEHVFVVMLENRSLDHMLGFAQLQGTDPLTGEPTSLDGLTGSEANLLPSGVRIPVSPGSDFTLPVDPGHEFDDVLEQLCGSGATYPAAGGGYPHIDNSGFASRLAKKLGSEAVSDVSVVMRGFRPDQLPVLNALATEFAVCDRWFSSLPGPTWPNRFFVHAASSGGLYNSPSALASAMALLDGYKFANGTLYDRLHSAGLSWSIVEGDALPQSLSINGMTEHVLEGRFLTLNDFISKVADPRFSDSYVFIEPHYGHVLSDGRNFKGGNSQHPLDDVTRGEKLLKDVYEAIRRSPHWLNSLLIISYDEHGGFYDHVAPPAAIPPGDAVTAANNSDGFPFDRLGVRVPAVIVSPYTPRGSIDHTVYDHTSILATVEHLYGLPPLTRRDASANRFDHLFGLASPRGDTPTTLPEPAHSGVAESEDLFEGLAADLETMPDHLAGPLEPALAGFIHVAMAREVHLAAAVRRDAGAALAAEKDRILSTVDGIRTKFDAVKYLRDVEQKYLLALQQRPR